MIRVRVAGIEIICETATEAADFLLTLESRDKTDSHNFDIRYFPGGKRPPVIADGHDFIMAIRLIEGRNMDSKSLATHFRLNGIQGLGPFFARINKQLQIMNPPRTLREFIEKKSAAGKPTSWSILKQEKSEVLFSRSIK